MSCKIQYCARRGETSGELIYLAWAANLQGIPPARSWPYSVPSSRGLTVRCCSSDIFTWNWRAHGPRTWSLFTLVFERSLAEGFLPMTHIAITLSSDTLAFATIFSNFGRAAEVAMTRVRVCRLGSSSRKLGSRSSMRTWRLVNCLNSPGRSLNWDQRRRSNLLAAARSLLHFLQVHGIPLQAWWAAPRVRSLNLNKQIYS